ncbi:MAG: hypothetical protein ACTTKP_03745 [Catonella sp.]|uniref:hypothetical protein n=1 Tax=Catonella sp. TaxID=2382125 RepID=UPI003F9F348C
MKKKIKANSKSFQGNVKTRQVCIYLPPVLCEWLGIKMNNAEIDEILLCIFQFYPGLAGEYGKTIYSLGDYSCKSINEFLIALYGYKKSLKKDIDVNYLAIKIINDRIYELVTETYKSQTYFYYGRTFLTLLESLSTTQNIDMNKQLFQKRLVFLVKIVSQAYENLDNQLLSRIEIMSTRKRFIDTCQKIENIASDLVNESYYNAKAMFQDLLDDKLKLVKRILPYVRKEEFIHRVERSCDSLFSVEDINKQLVNLLNNLSIEKKSLECDCRTSSQIQITNDYLNDYINSIVDMFGCLDKFGKKIDISKIVVSNTKYKFQTQDYRALISFAYEETLQFYINTNSVDDEDQLMNTVIHEIIPGHYFMSLFYTDNENRFFKETSFWEGWALLCEYHSLFIIDSESYRNKVSRKLISEVLVGIISFRLWYCRQSKEEIVSWLMNNFGIQKDVVNKLFLTAILQDEERMPYYVGFSAFCIMYDQLGFEKLLDKVMLSGASFYHLNKAIDYRRTR